MIPIQKSTLSKISQYPQFHSKISQRMAETSFQYDWKPTQAVILTNPYVLSKIKKFRNSINKKDLQEYGNLAIKQPMRSEELKVVYEGTWKNNIPEGYGIFYYDCGIFYEGYIKKGELEGYGLLILVNYECFYGNFKKNRPMGQATFQGYDRKVRGIFIEGQILIEGQIISYKQGTKIKMKSVDVGTIQYSNEMTYQGYIMNRQPCGKGKITFPNGNTYEGDILNGKFNGFGIYTWKDGYKFKGNYVDNERHGFGRFYHTQDLVEQCNWEKGNKSGDIKIYHKNKLIYTGTNQAEIIQIIEKYFLI